MLEHVVEVLTCPHDADGLRLVDASLICPAGHRFDLARQGYVNLLRGAAPAAADTAAMVAARERIQTAGHHGALTEALVGAAVRARGWAADPGPVDARPGVVVDLGAGTGHHLAAVVEGTAAIGGLALDVSKYAARRAARSHPRFGAVVCDVWERLPVRDGAASLVLDVFAPRHVAEIGRILAPGGGLIVATPGPDHLAPLVQRLGLLRVGGDKLERLDRDVSSIAVLRAREVVEAVMRLDHASVAAMIVMGPSSHHLDDRDLAADVTRLPEPIEVTFSVTVSSYCRR
jgi:23S rRNA (guanine745-N1)-methyltransferase